MTRTGYRGWRRGPPELRESRYKAEVRDLWPHRSEPYERSLIHFAIRELRKARRQLARQRDLVTVGLSRVGRDGAQGTARYRGVAYRWELTGAETQRRSLRVWATGRAGDAPVSDVPPKLRRTVLRTVSRARSFLGDGFPGRRS